MTTSKACILIELAMLLLGLALVHFFGLPWWTVLICLIAPPALLVLAIIASFTASTRNGGNPFQ